MTPAEQILQAYIRHVNTHEEAYDLILLAADTSESWFANFFKLNIEHSLEKGDLNLDKIFNCLDKNIDLAPTFKTEAKTFLKSLKSSEPVSQDFIEKYAQPLTYSVLEHLFHTLPQQQLRDFFVDNLLESSNPDDQKAFLAAFFSLDQWFKSPSAVVDLDADDIRFEVDYPFDLGLDFSGTIQAQALKDPGFAEIFKNFCLTELSEHPEYRATAQGDTFIMGMLHQWFCEGEPNALETLQAFGNLDLTTEQGQATLERLKMPAQRPQLATLLKDLVYAQSLRAEHSLCLFTPDSTAEGDLIAKQMSEINYAEIIHDICLDCEDNQVSDYDARIEILAAIFELYGEQILDEHDIRNDLERLIAQVPEALDDIINKITQDHDRHLNHEFEELVRTAFQSGSAPTGP